MNNNDKVGRSAGFSNGETWLVDLFLDCDDHGTYKKIKKQLRKRYSVAQKADLLAHYMRHHLDMTELELDNSLMHDMLMAAFGHVNWQEIIEKSYS
jgi:hypothetical protein